MNARTFTPRQVIKMFFPQFSTDSHNWQATAQDFADWENRKDWQDKTPKEILEYWASQDDSNAFLGTDLKPSEMLEIIGQG